MLRLKRNKKRSVPCNVVVASVTEANECWSMEFISDALTNGRVLRVFAVLDQFSRECLVSHAGHSLPAKKVTTLLDRLAVWRRCYPKYVRAEAVPNSEATNFIGGQMSTA